ncbi:DNA alkylation repair protein [Thermaurantimonas aggregans]|uniref:DNA alkylation repair protein n=1 Tax=Thermaurantimonas aggregans TaxID=2173829 RepID=UPI000F588D7A|nr:DNA alkylation repair protein [Thermaurantimonas aggregans]MCX8149073.1 DNA alkylation repair protein [Thermaurantimonas aggregans]
MEINSSIDWLAEAYHGAADLSKKPWMEAYMRNQFAFIGVPAPVRKSIQKQWFKEVASVKTSEDLIELVKLLYESNEREFQYTAIDLLAARHRLLSDVQMQNLLEKCITTKPWWDTVDFLATNIVGKWLYDRKELQKEIGQRWLNSKHLWLMRSALLFQLKYKEKTDFDLLHHYILSLADHRDFFIQKAIGWALREYSKTNPKQIDTFVKQHDKILSNLAKREALKWTKRLKYADN